MPNNDQRQDMKERVIVAIAVVFCVFILLSTDYGNHQTVYDCRMSDIIPDFPPEIREECRKLQREQRHEQPNNSRYTT